MSAAGTAYTRCQLRSSWYPHCRRCQAETLTLEHPMLERQYAEPNDPYFFERQLLTLQLPSPMSLAERRQPRSS